MLLSILVIIFLISQTLQGYRVGFTNKILSLISTALSFILAILFNRSVSLWLMTQFSSGISNPLSTDNLVSKFVAFMIVIFGGRLIVSLFMGLIRGLLPHRLLRVGVIRTTDRLLGGAVSFVIAYLIVYFLLSMANALQISWFVQQTIDSPFLQYIIYETPLLSQQIFNSIFGIETTTMNL